MAPRLPIVLVDAEQMRQVIINLVDNAMEMLGGSGAKRPDGAIPAIVVCTMCDHPTSKVRLTVSDNGPVCRPQIRDKLFMPYLTRPRGVAAGLGSPSSAVSSSNGTIEVSDVSPSGTTFTIELPCLPS